MTDAQIYEAFSAFEPESAIWRAITALLDRGVESSVEIVRTGSQSNEMLQFNAGALDNAMQLREKFFDLRDRAAATRRVK